MEEEANQLYRRPQVTGQAREEEEIRLNKMQSCQVEVVEFLESFP